MRNTYTAQIVQSDQLGTEPSVDTQKLLVHDSRQGEIAERVHARVIDCFGVLVLAWWCQLSEIGVQSEFEKTSLSRSRSKKPARASWGTSVVRVPRRP